MKSFLLDQESFIDIWKDFIHLYGFSDILELNDRKVALSFKEFQICILGENFRVLKLTKNEILVEGILEEMKVIR